MSMTGGTVTIGMNPDGTATYSGTGLAFALAQARVPARLAALPSPIVPLPTVNQKTAPYSPANPATVAVVAQVTSVVKAIYNLVQADCNADGPAIVTYLAGHAVAHVTTQQLGKLPASITTGTAIDAPTSPVDVPIT